MIIKGVEYTKEKLASMVDHAILDTDTQEQQIREACAIACRYKFKGVHPNPYWVPLVAQELEGTGIETDLVVSIPLGANPTSFKGLGTRRAPMIIDEIEAYYKDLVIE